MCAVMILVHRVLPDHHLGLRGHRHVHVLHLLPGLQDRLVLRGRTGAASFPAAIPLVVLVPERLPVVVALDAVMASPHAFAWLNGRRSPLISW